MEIESFVLYNIFMNTLSFFPDLLTYSMVGPLFLRLAMVFFVGYLSSQRLKENNVLIAIPTTIVGILLLLGLYTQIASILGIIIISTDYWINKGSVSFNTERKLLYGIVKIILLSLLFTGPGFLAFDLPL